MKILAKMTGSQV